MYIDLLNINVIEIDGYICFLLCNMLEKLDFINKIEKF